MLHGNFFHHLTACVYPQFLVRQICVPLDRLSTVLQAMSCYMQKVIHSFKYWLVE